MSDTPAPTPKALRIANRIIEVLLVLVLLSILGNTVNHALVFRAGLKLMEYHFEVLYYLMVARLATSIPWRAVLEKTLAQRIFLASAAVVFGLFVNNLLKINFPEAVKAIIVTRMAFEDATDDEIAYEITDWNKWYPQQRFVEKVLEAIPEDESEGILYFGDQRAHIMSYLLYPRPVYVLPRLQVLQNKAVEDNWTWTQVDDPLFPQADPLNPVRGKFPQEASPEIQAEARALIAEKNIKWAIYYDAIHPERSFVTRVTP